ncbi:hypothetical protein AST01_02430 [Staphylococcus equorum]|uniref:hypothetical protein n=1 Tax=Staphylococcus equorum TaxID=246432 RepID=UPI0008528D03|nr:hypothetical protein [Staphylococcus equorum]OEK71089.1 hypothetical protein AST01_02430 [Staphylococcus equorum]
MARFLEKENGLCIVAETKEQLLFKENSLDLTDYLGYHYKRVVNEIKNSPIYCDSVETTDE